MKVDSLRKFVRAMWWFAPGVKHRHGGSAITGITHIAIQEKKDGNVVNWMEQFIDEQYRRGQESKR